MSDVEGASEKVIFKRFHKNIRKRRQASSSDSDDGEQQNLR